MRSAPNPEDLMWRTARAFISLAFLSTAANAQDVTSAHAQLTQLAEDIVYTSARLYPTQATSLGITTYDAELEVPSEANRAAYIEQLQQWKKRLQAIVRDTDSKLSLVDRDDAKLLAARLAHSLNDLLVYKVDRKNYAG